MNREEGRSMGVDLEDSDVFLVVELYLETV